MELEETSPQMPSERFTISMTCFITLMKLQIYYRNQPKRITVQPSCMTMTMTRTLCHSRTMIRIHH
jgi:hypothetical protein